MADPIQWTGVRFRDPETGRFIPRRTVRRALEESLANVSRLTDTLVDDLRAGRISLNEWRDEMRFTVKMTQIAAAELAHGGRSQMTSADYGRVGQTIRRQYGFLEAWVAQIKAGLPLDNRLEPRAQQYLRSARSAFLAEETRTLNAAGFDEIRSVLHPAEHCAECIAEAARDFVPIGKHTPIGSRQCRGNDQCTAEFRNSRTGETVAA